MKDTVNHQILKLISQQVTPTPADLLYELAYKLNYPIADFMHVVDSLIDEKYIAKKNETDSVQEGNILFQFEESPRYFILPKGVDFIKSDNEPKNSINITGNVTGSQIGQSSDFRDFKNKLKVENKTQADNETINQKSIFDIKVLVQYLAWIAGIASAILVYWKYFKG